MQCPRGEGLAQERRDFDASASTSGRRKVRGARALATFENLRSGLAGSENPSSATAGRWAASSAIAAVVLQGARPRQDERRAADVAALSSSV